MSIIYTCKNYHVYCDVNQTIHMALFETLKLNLTMDCLE